MKLNGTMSVGSKDEKDLSPSLFEPSSGGLVGANPRVLSTITPRSIFTGFMLA